MDGHQSSRGDTAAVEVIDTPEGLEKIRTAYQAVYRADPDAGVFLSWDWLSRIFEDHPDQWRIYAVRDDRVKGGYSGFLPLHCFMRWSASRKKFQTTLTDAGRLGLSDYVGFLCIPQLEEDVLRALGDDLAIRPWARLSLRYEPTKRRAEQFSESFKGDDFIVEWPEQTTDRGATNLLVCPVLDLPGSYEAYFAGLDPKTRKFLRRCVDAITDLEDTRYKVTNSDSFEEDREGLLDLWSIRWEEKRSERKVRELVDEHRTLLDRTQAAGLLYQVSLWQQDRMLASVAHVVDRKARSLHALIDGRDEENDRLNTGILLHVFSVQKAIEAGCTAYDFGHGNAPHKYRLGAEDREVSYLAVSRRSASDIGSLDPAMIGQALKRTEKLIKKGDMEAAGNAIRQIQEAWAG